VQQVAPWEALLRFDLHDNRLIFMTMARRLYRLDELQENAKHPGAYGGPKSSITEFAYELRQVRSPLVQNALMVQTKAPMPRASCTNA
jgi:hypothetical protein